MSDLSLSTDGHGSITGDFTEGGWTIVQGVDYHIGAVPDSGYVFWYWQVTLGKPAYSDIYNPDLHFMSFMPVPGDDIAFVAHFQPEFFLLNVIDDGNGRTIPSFPIPVSSGTNNTIVAIPATNYFFKNWSVQSGDASIANAINSTTTVSITANATIKANFDTKLISVDNIPNDSPGIGMELRSDGKIYCYVIDARDTGNTDQLNYQASVCANNSTIAVFNTSNINFYDGGYHNILFEWSLASNESRYGILHVDNKYYSPESSSLSGIRVGKQTPCTFTFDAYDSSISSALGTYLSLGANLYGEGCSALTGFTKNNKTFTGKYNRFVLWDTVLTNPAYLKITGDYDPFVSQIVSQAEINPLTDSNLLSWSRNVVAYHRFDSLDVSISAPIFSAFSPVSGATGVPASAFSACSLSTDLTWVCTDPLGLDITYDVYFGLASAGSAGAVLIASSITSSTATVTALSIITEYNWYVIASNYKLSTTSQVNTFTTRTYGGWDSFSAVSLNLTSSISSTIFDKSILNFENATLSSSFAIYAVSGEHNWVAVSEDWIRMSVSATDKTVGVSIMTAPYNYTELNLIPDSVTSISQTSITS
jgi:hypothetical protein